MKRDRDMEPKQEEGTLADSQSLFGVALAVFSSLSLCCGGSFLLPLSFFVVRVAFPSKKMWCEVG